MGTKDTPDRAGTEPSGLDVVDYFVNAPISDAERILQLGHKIIRERKSGAGDSPTKKSSPKQEEHGASGQPTAPSRGVAKAQRPRKAAATPAEYASQRDPGGAEKLNADSVRLIRQLYGEEEPATLSRDFGVSIETIERIAAPQRRCHPAPHRDE